MKKLIILIALLAYTTTLFGAYDVKLGVYKNAKNLRANIAKIKPTKYRNYIKIDKKKNLNYVHAVIEGNKEARNALRVYKRVFKDAFISKKQVKLRKKVKKVSTPVPKVKPVVKVKKEEQKEPMFTKELLLDKKVYLCYEKEAAVMKKRIVQMHFKKAYVEYLLLESKNKTLNLKYTFTQDTIILPMSSLLVTHKIVKKNNNFLSGKSYINGKEAHSLRYYFNKEAAEAFVAGH